MKKERYVLLQSGMATWSGLYMCVTMEKVGMFVTKGCGHWEWFMCVTIEKVGMFVTEGCGHWKWFMCFTTVCLLQRGVATGSGLYMCVKEVCLL